jgi:O-antigen/teichoic acid export membrane protein
MCRRTVMGFLDETLELGRNSATGGLQLLVGKILSTFILAAGTIVLGWFILEGDYGLYAIALIPATTILLFQDWGVGPAMTRSCAQCRAANNQSALRRIIVTGLTFEVASGIVLTVAAVGTSSFIASTVFGRPESAFLVTLASATILTTAIFVAVQNIFVGFEAMKYNSIVIICQAIVQGFFAPALVYLGYGAFGAVLGYALASVTVCAVSLFMLYFLIYRKLEKNRDDHSSAFQVLRPLLNYGVPLAIATISAGVLTQFFSIMMAAFCSDAVIGNYRIATNFGILLTFFTFPISTVLFPVFSKLNPSREAKLLKTVFGSSVKYTALLLVPATLAMMVLAEPIIGTLYASKWLEAPWFMVLSVSSNLLAVFGYLSVQSLLVGLGETKLLMKTNLLSIAVGVPLGVFLIPPFGIVGLLVSALIAVLPGLAINLYVVWRRYEVKVDFGVSFRILLASLIAAGASFALLSVLHVSQWLQLVSGGALFLAVYLFAAPLVGAINLMDIRNLKSMISGLGVISDVLQIPLAIMEVALSGRG